MLSLDKNVLHGAAVPEPSAPISQDIRQWLIQIGKLTSAQAAQAAARAKAEGLSFLDAVLALNFVRRDELMTALSRHYSYPILEGGVQSTRFSSELIVGHSPFSPAAEVFRSIRTSIAPMIGEGTRSFLVTGPRHGEGTTYFAGNLAVAFAQMLIPTLLVDANLRTPRIAQMFGLSSDVGLSDSLRDRSTESPPIVPNVIRCLSILPAGTIPPNPQELLASADFLGLVNNLQATFGVVIYDTAAGMDYADAQVVASRVAAAIVIARQHETTFNDVSALVKKLQGINCKVLGSVLNTI